MVQGIRGREGGLGNRQISGLNIWLHERKESIRKEKKKVHDVSKRAGATARAY